MSMLPNNDIGPLPTNRRAIISLVGGGLALTAACIGMIPIPLTGFVCFPAAAILAIVALTGGIRSMRQLRASRERGRQLAIIGISIGTAVLSAALCLVTATVVLWSHLAEIRKQLHW